MYHSFSSVFMMNNTPTGAKKKHCESTESDNHQTLKCFSVTHNGFHTKKQHVTLTSPSLSHNSEVSWGSLNRSLKNYGFITDAIFKNWCMCTSHLATKQLLFKIVELEIQLCAWRQGESLASIVDSVFEEPGQWIFSQYCIHLLRKPMITDLLLCDRWQTSAQACTWC